MGKFKLASIVPIIFALIIVSSIFWLFPKHDVLIIIVAAWLAPRYYVYVSRVIGRANMIRSEQNNEILIEGAKARLEAEKLNHQSEIERAKGIKESMSVKDKL